MLSRHRQLMGRYERVQDFLAANPPPNPAPAYAALRQDLGECISRLNVLLSDQAGGKKDSRDDTGRLRRAVRLLRAKHLAPVSQIAKAELADDPVVRKALQMPHGRLSVMRLIAEAAAFRQRAAKHEQVFVDAGRPADFLARMDGAIESVRATVLDRAENVGRHVGAKLGITQELAGARKLLLKLDVIVREAFSANDRLLGQWKLASRVQNLPGPRGTGGTAEENVPSAA